MINLFQKNTDLSIHNEKTFGDVLLEITAAMLLLIMWGITLYIIHTASDPIAIHFNVKGAADGWGAPQELYYVSGIATIVMVVMAAGAYNPKMIHLPIRLNPQKLSQQYRIIARMSRVSNVVSGSLFIFILLAIGASLWEMNAIVFKGLALFATLVLFGVMIFYTVRIYSCK